MRKFVYDEFGSDEGMEISKQDWVRVAGQVIEDFFKADMDLQTTAAQFVEDIIAEKRGTLDDESDYDNTEVVLPASPIYDKVTELFNVVRLYLISVVGDENIHKKTFFFIFILLGHRTNRFTPDIFIYFLSQYITVFKFNVIQQICTF